VGSSPGGLAGWGQLRNEPNFGLPMAGRRDWRYPWRRAANHDISSEHDPKE
jgi:hypothetical protein